MATQLDTSLPAVGVWSTELRGAAHPAVRDAATELDERGFRALWVPGLDGGGAVDDVDHLLEAAPHVTVTLGVLAIWGQEPVALGNRLAALDAAHGPRTVLGFGVSDAHSAARAGQDYGRPVESMGRWLDALDAAPRPVPAGRRILGALGPRMADLAAARTAGWHPFLVTPDYTAAQRERLGAQPLIAPHLAVVLDRDPERARAAARAGIGMFIDFPAYRANLARLGFTEDDLVPGGSDRLIDALVAWGDLDAVSDRIREHLDAGADHLALHVLRPDQPDRPALPLPQWRDLATLLPSFTPATP
ncbi:TIGR03620 family F420-dependent LLM class oxidoreductase [Micromonospora halotolerans]|uniref:TIGR03620 family F420-dependent LLM class oxidoreductase n=1 Tax=Micromonospora halotolerans TaxID=709879 RepID=A0ABY9ZVY6_9ACTN|nr:TIGR03620 family F420-dependent LLM class oxidoreductase [Micromonospora halotolerans]WNM39408.1 TIGR03620 family F420-dependent LLM class oxidoreductase [Micromonospora halotolerans]